MSLPWKLRSTLIRMPAMTDSNSAASHSQTLMLSGPLKYSPVMRQNCLPHVVNR